MALQNILVAYDKTEGAIKALELAKDFARLDEGVHLDVVYVAPIPLLDDQHLIDFKEVIDAMVAEGKTLVSEAVESLDDVQDQASALILTSTNPASELVKLVEDRDYDLLIIGSRGLTGMREYLGSVSHKVLHSVSIPVLIAK